MDSSRWLITGANGQLGRALTARFPEATAVTRDHLDISSQKAVDNFNWDDFEVIINAAAYTKVDEAETIEGRKLAWQTNASGAAHLARIASRRNLTIIHISTEYVFDGAAVGEHPEDEPFTPLSTYAASKAAGDIAAATAPQHYILRTEWVIGDGHNFVRTMQGLAAKDISPAVVSDQIGRLTFTSTLVDTISHLLETQAEFGTYNVSNDGQPASWAEITRQIFKALGREDLTVTDTTTEAYFKDKLVAKRPLNSVLDLSKIKQTGLRLRDWRDDLKQYIANNA